MAILDSQLGTERLKTSAFVVSGPAASTNITGHATPCELKVSFSGGTATTVSIAVAGLNTGLLIAAALQVGIRALTSLGIAATEARVVYSADQARYAIFSGTRGSTSTLAITAGATDDIAADLMLLSANGAVATAGANDLDLSLVLQRLGGPSSLATLDAETAFLSSPSRVRGQYLQTAHAIAGGVLTDHPLYTANFPRKACVAFTLFQVTAGAAGGRTATLRDTAGGAGNVLQLAVFDCATAGLKTAFGHGANNATLGGSVYLNKSNNAVAGNLTILWLFQD